MIPSADTASRRLVVAEIVSGPGLNGAARHCYLLSQALAARGHRVLLLHRPGAWIARQPHHPEITLVPTSLERTQAEFRRIIALLAGAGVDVTHSHMSAAHSFGAILRLAAGIPTVSTAHTTKLQLHWMVCDRVIAVSEATARFQRRVNLVRRSRIRIIPNFVEVDAIPQATVGNRLAARKALGLPPHGVVIGCVGDVIPRKNQSGLTRAVMRLRDEGLPVRLVLIGGAGGPEGEAVRALAAQAGHDDAVLLTGRRDDGPALSAAFDIAALNSREEALPLSLIEAMSAGLPLVATGVGGVPELISEGENGFLIPAGDDAALVDRLRRLAEDADLRRHMGESGRRRAEHRHSAMGVVGEIEAVLSEAADRAGRWTRRKGQPTA